MKTIKVFYISPPMIPHENNVTIITPCFNENHTVIAFLKELTDILKDLPFYFNIVVVDDASTDNTLDLLRAFHSPYENVGIRVLTLKYNCNHQGAIYQGFLYSRGLPGDKFIVMDSDGEDDPAAIRELVYLDDYKVVNVVRGRRRESLWFRLSYRIYKYIFRAITGRSMNFGNYCMIDRSILEKVSNTSFVHLAACLSKQKVEKKQLVYDRRKRIDGKSKMNTTSLIHHAFRSFVEYAEEFLMVFLRIFIVIILAISGLMATVFYRKFISHKAILGWASNISLGLFNSALICIGFFILGILLLNISSRRRSTNTKIYIDTSKQEYELVNPTI
ncbi:glycosyltransferase [Desertivirga brevis]|uniref:glycosyltransferase n=1 Tax=Desertivirga brevis TaxID=2810310 RepID=UPI001A96D00D|nr:glycosyltransferase [Pedobacter sp. SYSU D00873]